jgi:hypothetical protein
MRIVFAIVLITGWSATAAGQVQAAGLPFTLSISAEDVVVKPQADIYVNIQMTNTSKHDIDCSSSDNDMLGMDVKYHYDVRDGSGTPVPTRQLKHPELATGHFRLCTLKPGKVANSNGNLINKLYDLSQPRQYVIQVSRDVSANPADGVVKSNKVTVTVTP